MKSLYKYLFFTAMFLMFFTGAAANFNIAVIENSGVANVINDDSQLNAQSITPSDLDSSYDAVICPRTSAGFKDTTCYNGKSGSSHIVDYVENGHGGYVGELESNYFPIQKGWISGSSSYGNGQSSITGLNTRNSPNHYLDNNINWGSLPYDSDPIDYAADFSISDSSANIIAEIDHDSFGVTPFVVSKANPYGSGHIVIANSDYQDSPGYNSAMKDAIQEWAYWAAKTSNSPPSVSNPDPAQSKGTSPVYTTSPNLNIDVTDPQGESIDVTFYQANSGDSFNVNQGGNTWTVTPYTSNEGSGSYYPGPISGSSDFLLAGYRDTSTGDESILFGTESNSNMDAQLNLLDVPSGSTITRVDDTGGAGNSRHSRDELSLSHEPEGDWGWGSCCTDGAALQLGDGWTSLKIDPDTNIGVGPNFVFYGADGSRIDLDKTQQITISQAGGKIDASNNVDSGGRATIEWSGLTEGETYSWYAEACDSNGACTFSNKFTFKVSPGPLAPDNPSPSEGAVISAQSGDVELSARYRHAGGKDPGTLTFHNSDDSVIGSCQAAHKSRCSVTKSVTNGQRYDWYVVAQYDGQTATSSQWHFLTNTPPEKPTNLNPGDDSKSINYNSKELSAYVEDADGDDLDITFEGTSPSDSFSKTTTISGSGTASVNVNNLASGEVYDWSVTAEDSHGVSTTSDTVSFTTNYLPAIKNPNPVDGEYISTDEVDVSISVSDNDKDSTNIRIYDGSGTQIGSGSTSDGSAVTVSADYNGLSYGNTYQWTVEAEDNLGTNSRTFSFNVIGGGSFRSLSEIKYKYSSVIKSTTQSKFIKYKITNRNTGSKDLVTSLSGPDATFSEYSGSSHTYTLAGGQTKTFRIQVNENQPGEYMLDINTRDTNLGIDNNDNMPVIVRNYPASNVKRTPGLGAIQILLLLTASLMIVTFRKMKLI